MKLKFNKNFVIWWLFWWFITQFSFLLLTSIQIQNRKGKDIKIKAVTKLAFQFDILSHWIWMGWDWIETGQPHNNISFIVVWNEMRYMRCSYFEISSDLKTNWYTIKSNDKIKAHWPDKSQNKPTLISTPFSFFFEFSSLQS